MGKVKFNLELLQGKKVAVNCATEEQAKEYATWVKSLGIDMCTNTYWNEDKDKTCYLLCHNLFWHYGSKTTFENLRYKVVSFEEALLKEKKTKKSSTKKELKKKIVNLHKALKKKDEKIKNQREQINILLKKRSNYEQAEIYQRRRRNGS